MQQPPSCIATAYRRSVSPQALASLPVQVPGKTGTPSSALHLVEPQLPELPRSESVGFAGAG
jgi:hypothetical protein